MRLTVASSRAWRQLKNLLFSSAMLRSRNAPSAMVNQARGFAVQNGGSFTALLFAGGASSCCAASMLHVLSLGHHM
jgi:hypothetical protein